MSGMPGTMGKDLFAFAGMWGLMMTAMMLPSAAPFATLYSRTFDSHRLQRALQFALGYLVIWTISGVPAFALAWIAGEAATAAPMVGTALAWIAGEAATAAPMVGTALAVAIFAGCGVYQLTPLKYRCLSHCRTPLGDVLHYSNYRGRVRDLRVGLSHGAYCLACCWALMALMAAFGFMTLLAMAALAGVVAIEKLWSRGEAFGRATGVVALGLGRGRDLRTWVGTGPRRRRDDDANGLGARLPRARGPPPLPVTPPPSPGAWACQSRGRGRCLAEELARLLAVADGWPGSVVEADGLALDVAAAHQLLDDGGLPSCSPMLKMLTMWGGVSRLIACSSRMPRSRPTSSRPSVLIRENATSRPRRASRAR